MNQTKATVLYFTITMVVFLLIDGIWLGVIARGFYVSQIGYLAAPSPNWPAAFAFYLLYTAGLLFFIIVPGIRENHPLLTLGLRGAFFGLVAYGTYDLTCLAVVKDWPLPITIVDMAWGAVLTASTVTLSSWICRKIS